MSFDQHSSMVVLDMMRGMSYLPAWGWDDINEHVTFVEIRDIVDEAMPHEEFVDEMLAMSSSQIKEIASPELASPFDLGVSVIEIAEEIQVALAPKIAEDVIAVNIFNTDDKIAQHDSNDDSSFVSNSDPIDQRVLPATGDTKIVDFGTAELPKELRIGSNLSTDERDNLIQLLGYHLDIFAWSYEDMSGLDPSIVQHRLPLLPHARPVKQKLR
ncbi:hypothetical protein CK203_023128 [Vitis vinifera]|uniref:Uncharacterized protein n=1 Tax=Vitis vinifera TaxID=29760 RepID=A0A438J1L2_VITVI|nr:hypothetical protein CK203_023128 [Vitis vinifera]